MAALDDLISQIPDESLRERIRAEVKRVCPSRFRGQ